MKRIARPFAAMLALLLATGPTLAQGIDGRDFYRHDDFGFGHMLFGGLFMIAFWAGIIVLIVVAVRWLGGGPARHERPSGRPTALEILQERYARGEIDHDEFERRRQLLSQ